MPALPPLALRYLLWLIGLRILHIGAVNFLGVPNALATTVILASVPAMDIGMEAARKATRALGFRDWAMIWGVMICIYLILNIVIPAMLVPGFSAALTDGSGLGSVLVVALATAVMMVLFLWIGVRVGGKGR